MDKYNNSKFIFVIGIGGSDLASKAVWNALTLHKQTAKKIFFLESPDLREYEEIGNFFKNEITSLEEIVLIVISKSGQTTETLETFHKTFDLLSEKFGTPVTERILIISSPDSTLWKLAESKNMQKISWEGDVGGRFSAFTAAHTTVLRVAGLNTDAFIEGGKETSEILAQTLAKNIFNNYKEGADILDFFIFNSELEDLGKWCRQLIAESLGKENKDGIRVGITPTVSLGPTDLHSMLQLTLGGPKNKFTLFIRSLKEISDSINEEAYQNTVKAYEDERLPFLKYEMPEINEKEIGKFMSIMIEATLKLAELLKVDPYGQPAVEEYKKHLTHNN